MRGVQPWYNNYELLVEYFIENKKYQSIDYGWIPVGYNSLLRKIILIIGDIFCLYLATSIAMALELGNKQTDKIAFFIWNFCRSWLS